MRSHELHLGSNFSSTQKPLMRAFFPFPSEHTEAPENMARASKDASGECQEILFETFIVISVFAALKVALVVVIYLIVHLESQPEDSAFCIDSSDFKYFSSLLLALPLPADMEYHELTPADESDLKEIMESCKWAIGNAEAFTERLAEELSGLDGANIHSIMGSEKQVQELIKLLDSALWELESTESRLQDYDTLLRAVRDSMELMEEKDNSLRVEDQNRRKLVTQIESLVVR